MRHALLMHKMLRTSQELFLFISIVTDFLDCEDDPPTIMGTNIEDMNVETSPQWITYTCPNGTYFQNSSPKLRIACDPTTKTWGLEEEYTNLYAVKMIRYHPVQHDDYYICVKPEGKETLLLAK